MDFGALPSIAWQVFQESNDAVLITCREHIVRDANPFAQRLTGLTRSDLLECPVFELLEGPGESIESMLSALAHTGVFHSREQFQLRRATGPPLPVNLSVSRVHVGDETFGVVIARDISERVEAERRLQQSHDELEQRVAERTADLQAAHDRLLDEVRDHLKTQTQLRHVNEQMAAAMEQLKAAEQQAVRQEQLRLAGQLASGMAHDINNSVTPILNLVQLLLDSDLTAVQSQYVAQIQQCATDIATTVQRLREVRPLPAALHPGPIALPELLQSASELTRPRWDDEAQHRGVSIDLALIVHEDVTVFADESALRTVLTNLVFNAADAIHTAGTIELECGRSDGHGLIVVTDDGEGMTPDQLARCWEPFITTRANGCGLGLSLCKRIVEQHGGRIELESTMGFGTTVRILLPLAPDAISPQPALPVSISGRFLYVDDDEVVRRSTRLLLEMKGLDVDVAADASEALRRLELGHYDVVISDLGLPGMDGRQLLRECRARWPKLVRVLISGWIDDDVSTDEDDLAQATLPKPFSVEDFFRRMDALLQHG